MRLGVLLRSVVVIGWIAVGCASGATAADVVEIARSFADGGGYDRSWKSSGVPEAIVFKNEQILKASTTGSYCCGYTLAVAMKAAEQRGLLADKSVDQIRKFQKQWYGATDDDKETLCVYAVEQLEIGKRVRPRNARPGDFLQYWRSNDSGHSVVFLGWIEEAGKPIGFTYRSSQGSTDGIGDQREYFVDAAGKNGRVVPDRMHFCRLNKRP